MYGSSYHARCSRRPAGSAAPTPKPGFAEASQPRGLATRRPVPFEASGEGGRRLRVIGGKVEFVVH